MEKLQFSQKIGDLLFDGYYKGGKDGNPKIRQGNGQPRQYDEAVMEFPFLLGKIKSTVVMVDYDDPNAFQCRLKIAEALHQHCIVIKSTNKGGHFYWNNIDQQIKNNTTGNKTLLTLFPVDYKCGIKLIRSTGEVKAADQYGCLSNDDRSFREVVYCNLNESGGLDEVPFYDCPLKSGDKFSFLGMGEGSGRQDGLFTYMNPIKDAGFTYEQFKEIAELIEQYIFAVPLGLEFENAVRLEAWEGAGSSDSFGSGSTFQHNKFAEYMIEKYHIKKINGQLHTYQGGVYVPGTLTIEAMMIDEINWIKKRQRNEVIDYMLIRCKETVQCGFNYIAFNNGVYNLDTNELEPLSSNRIITNKIPWDYNPDAQSDLVDLVLDRLACGDETIRYQLEEAAGACLYRSNTLGGGKMIILKGEKSNGKSTFLDMVKTMVGKENYSTLDTSEIGDRFNTAMLFGKLANIGDDISDNFIQETSQLKKIITGNELKAEYKGQNPFNFTPYCTMIFSANDIPHMKDKTGAMQRRLLIIPMNAVFNKSSMGSDFDPAITYELQRKEHIEYLIQLALDGLAAVRKGKAFTESKQTKDALDSYEKENNPILAFIEECDADRDILNQSTGDVFRKYEIFCSDEGIKPVARSTFSKKLVSSLGLRVKDARLNGVKTRIYERDCSA